MPLKLVPPGTRKGYTEYYARGTINGIAYEENLRTADEKEAEIAKAELELFIRRLSRPAGVVTFKEAAERYIIARSLNDRDQRWVRSLYFMIGETPVGDIVQDDIVRCASVAYQSAASRNRAVLRPIAAVVHYAADNKWCAYQRFKAFKEPTPKNRCVEPEIEKKLLKLTGDDPIKHLLILWLFKHGNRISEVLNLRYRDIDFEKLTFRLHLSKNDTYQDFPLNEEVASRLNRKAAGEAFVFPWRTRSGVHKWLRPLVKGQDMVFSPHMARHTVGKRLSDQGASLTSIMGKLGHLSVKSSMRYQAKDIETIRKYG